MLDFLVGVVQVLQDSFDDIVRVEGREVEADVLEQSDGWLSEICSVVDSVLEGTQVNRFDQLFDSFCFVDGECCSLIEVLVHQYFQSLVLTNLAKRNEALVLELQLLLLSIRDTFHVTFG